jgi:hypothetical protein
VPHSSQYLAAARLGAAQAVQRTDTPSPPGR